MRIGSELAVLDPLTGVAYRLETTMPAPTELWAPLAVADARVFSFEGETGLVDLVSGDRFDVDLDTWQPSSGRAGGAAGALGDVVVLGVRRSVTLEGRDVTAAGFFAVDVNSGESPWQIQISTPRPGLSDDLGLLLPEQLLVNPQRTLAVHTAVGGEFSPGLHLAGLVDAEGLELVPVGNNAWPLGGAPMSVRGWMDDQTLLVRQEQPAGVFLYDVITEETEPVTPRWSDQAEIYPVGDATHVIAKEPDSVGVVNLHTGDDLWRVARSDGCDPILGNPGWPGS